MDLVRIGSGGWRLWMEILMMSKRGLAMGVCAQVDEVIRYCAWPES